MHYKSPAIEYDGHIYHFIAGEGMNDAKMERVVEKFYEQAIHEPDTLQTINNGPLVLDMERNVKKQVRSEFNNKLYWVEKTAINEFEFSKDK